MIVFELFRFYVMRHWSHYGLNGALEMTFINERTNERTNELWGSYYYYYY